MDKPYAVMTKIKKTIADAADDVNMNYSDDTDNTSYNVVAIVKQKLVFKNRPRPIIVTK